MPKDTDPRDRSGRIRLQIDARRESMPLHATPPARATRRIKTKPDFCENLSARCGIVADGLSYKQDGDLTGTNFGTVRRYMQTGSVPVTFPARFCEAFEINPAWLLYRTGRCGAAERWYAVRYER
jgi:hypothetical protein